MNRKWLMDRLELSPNLLLFATQPEQPTTTTTTTTKKKKKKKKKKKMKKKKKKSKQQRGGRTAQVGRHWKIEIGPVANDDWPAVVATLDQRGARNVFIGPFFRQPSVAVGKPERILLRRPRRRLRSPKERRPFDVSVDTIGTADNGIEFRVPIVCREKRRKQRIPLSFPFFSF